MVGRLDRLQAALQHAQRAAPGELERLRADLAVVQRELDDLDAKLARGGPGPELPAHDRAKVEWDWLAVTVRNRLDNMLTAAIVGLLSRSAVPMTTTAIYEALVELGVAIPGKSPRTNVGAHMANGSPLLFTRGEQGWTLTAAGKAAAANLKLPSANAPTSQR